MPKKRYTGYLAAAKRLGISGGVGDNLFAPDTAITRQEMFTLLYNVLKERDQLPAGTSDKTLADFSDSGSISSYAREATAYLLGTRPGKQPLTWVNQTLHIAPHGGIAGIKRLPQAVREKVRGHLDAHQIGDPNRVVDTWNLFDAVEQIIGIGRRHILHDQHAENKPGWISRTDRKEGNSFDNNHTAKGSNIFGSSSALRVDALRLRLPCVDFNGGTGRDSGALGKLGAVVSDGRPNTGGKRKRSRAETVQRLLRG